jgi:hypothetical protein
MMGNEIIKIELTEEGRLFLCQQIIKQAKSLGYHGLYLGFKLPDLWPFECEVLFSQFMVIARKLKMQILWAAQNIFRTVGAAIT